MAVEKCCVCGKDSPNQCATCKSVNYCSASCQKSDWPLHKLLCGKYKPFTKAGPPSISATEADAAYAAYKLAIRFPENSADPELIWVKRLALDEMCDGVAVSHYETVRADLGSYMKWPTPMPSLRFGHELQTYMGDDVYGDPDHGPNKCFASLNSGYQEGDLSMSQISISRFCGDLVILRYQTKSDLETGDEFTAFQDITLADLRHTFEFMSYRNTIFEADKPNRYYLRTAGEWIKAVKISCSGDMKYMNKPKYREVAVRRFHKIFQVGANVDVCNISMQMGFPLLVKKMNIDRSWFHEIKNCQITGFDPCFNREVGFLMHNMDVSSSVDEWSGFDAMKWDNGIDYTVLVARKDKKEVTTYQVEALVDYIRNVMLDYIMRQDQENEHESRYDTQVRKCIVNNLILSDKFKKFFDKFEEKIKAGDASWAEAKFFGGV